MHNLLGTQDTGSDLEVACSFGNWVPADKVKEEADEAMPDAVEVKEEKPESMVREQAVGTGRAFLCCKLLPTP